MDTESFEFYLEFYLDYIKYFPDEYKTRELCEQAIESNHNNALYTPQQFINLVDFRIICF